MLSLTSCLCQEWQPRESVVGLIKNAFFASCSSSSSAHVAVELDSILPQVKTEKVDLIVHGKMTFLFTTKYVKIRFQLQIL